MEGGGKGKDTEAGTDLVCSKIIGKLAWPARGGAESDMKWEKLTEAVSGPSALSLPSSVSHEDQGPWTLLSVLTNTTH